MPATVLASLRSVSDSLQAMPAVAGDQTDPCGQSQETQGSDSKSEEEEEEVVEDQEGDRSVAMTM